MEYLDLEKIEKNIEVYKYMFWSNIGLDQNEIDFKIEKSISEDKSDLMEYTISVSLETWCDANLEDVTIKLDTIRKKIENFISEYQINSKGKIIRSSSKKFIYMGPMLINLKFEMDNEELSAYFQYHIETKEEK